jgi:hypothetical protein
MPDTLTAPHDLSDLPESAALSVGQLRRLVAEREPDLLTLPAGFHLLLEDHIDVVRKLTGRMITMTEAVYDLADARAKAERRKEAPSCWD